MCVCGCRRQFNCLGGNKINEDVLDGEYILKFPCNLNKHTHRHTLTWGKMKEKNKNAGI